MAGVQEGKNLVFKDTNERSWETRGKGMVDIMRQPRGAPKDFCDWCSLRHKAGAGGGGGEQPFCCESNSCTAPDITKREWEEEEAVWEGNKTECVASPGLRKTQVSGDLRVKTKLVYITTENHWVRTTSVLCKQSKGHLKFSNVERNFCDWNRDSLTLPRRTLQNTSWDTMERGVTLGLQ